MTENKGELIQEYKTSKAMRAVYGMFIGMMVLFALACISLPFLFPNDRDIIYVSIFAVLLFSSMAAIFFFVAKKRMDKPIYHLYSEGVQYTYKNVQYFMPAGTLKDFYYFSTGKTLAPNNLAFKSDGREQWELISNHYGGDTSAIIEVNIDKRVAYLFDCITQHKLVTFQFISAGSFWKKSFTALSHKSFFNIKTQPVILSKTSLNVDGNSYSLDQLEPVAKNMLNNFYIAGKDGRKVFSFSHTSLMDCDTFIELYSRLKNN